MGVESYVRANMWKIISLYLLCVLAFVAWHNNAAVLEVYQKAYDAGCWNSYVDTMNRNSNYEVGINGVPILRNRTIVNITIDWNQTNGTVIGQPDKR